jgi:hypothetical protein
VGGEEVKRSVWAEAQPDLVKAHVTESDKIERARAKVMDGESD